MKKSSVFALALSLALAAAVPAAAQTKIAISGWPGNPEEENAIKSAVEAFNAKGSGIQLNWEPVPGNYAETLKTRLAGGTAPDLFYLDVSVFEEFARTGSLLPLDNYLKGFNLKDFPAPLLEAFTYNSRLYGVAKDFSTLALFYNKGIFDKAGLAYPKAGLSYADFYALCKTLKSKGVDNPVVINADFNRLIPFVLANGGRVVDDNLRIALGEPKAKAAVQAYVDMVVKDKTGVEAANVGAGWEGEAFGNEKVAMILSGPWCLGFLKGSFPNVYAKMGVVEMPRGEKKSTMIYTVSWSVNKQTKNREAAIEALKYLVTEGQKIFVEKAGVLGSNNTVAKGDTSPIKVPFYKGAEYGSAWRVKTPSGLFSRANDEINARLRDAFYGKITVDQMVDQIVAGYETWVE